MTSPMLTVLVLAVLWLIVVVPMIVRRNDERAGARSAARFSSAMRALSSRRVTAGSGLDEAVDDASSPTDLAGDAPAIHVSGAVNRRPVPVSKESLMYPPDRHEMSEARRQMMARRRRALTVLGGGSALLFLISLITGATFAWVLEVLFLISLGGYVLFLRAQARADRERRANRLHRSTIRSADVGYDATAAVPDAPHLVRAPDSAVRIDEDDVDLDHLDTVDLTGLYSEVEFDDLQTRRAG